MRWLIVGTGLMVSVLEIGCGGAEWMHPTKPKDMFAQDWNKCAQDIALDPKLQQGMRYMTLSATERCVQKKGWVLVEQ
jgi:hypothetical protein